MEPRPFPSQSAQNVQSDTDPAALADMGNFTGMSFYGAPPIQRQEEEPEETAPETIQAKCSECEAESPEPTVQRREEEEDGSDESVPVQPMAEEGEAVSEDETPLQAKLSVGKPGDKYEQEADNMAAQVMAMGDPTAENVQRQEMGEEETLQQKPLADNVTPVVQPQTSETPQQDSASQNLESQLAAEKGGGSPLSDEVQGFMEPRFGADFSEVRVHTGSAAVQMNQELGAQAFTHGNDIYYGKGKAPGNDALTAHELTHTIQQGGSTSYPGISMQESNQEQGPTFSQWLHEDPGEKIPQLKQDLIEKKHYKVVLYKRNRSNQWEKVINRNNIDWNSPASNFAWYVGSEKQKDPSQPTETIDTIVPKCEKLLLPHHFVTANKNPRDSAQTKAKISDAIIKDWKKVASLVQSLTGQEINAGDTKRELANATEKPGADSFSWHKTGRAIDLARDLKWLITEDPSRDSTYFRLYLPSKSNSDSNSEYSKKFNKADSVEFHKKGWYTDKKLYSTTFIDITAILEAHGFKRIKAHEGWDKKNAPESKQEWWHYDKRDSMTWYAALQQVYAREEIIEKVKSLVDDYPEGEKKAKDRLKQEGFPEKVLNRIFE